MSHKVLLVSLAIISGVAAFPAVQAGSSGSLPASAQSKPPSPRADEAPTLAKSDVPTRLVPPTVALDAAEAAAFRARWSRIAQYRRSGSPDLTPAAGSPITAHARTELGGGIWSVTIYRNTDGLFCHGENLGDHGQAMGCVERASLFEEGPLFVGSGRRQARDPAQWNVFWTYGFTAPPVVAVEIISTDCSREEVPLDSEGVFLDLTAPARIYDGVWPYRVLGKDAEGNVVAEERLPLRPPDTDAARAAEVRAPRPARCRF